MATHIIEEELKQIEKSHGGSLNHWVGGIIHITFQTKYDIQYLTMRLSGYMNSPTEPAFIDLKHGMEYLMHHTHEPIMYSRKKIIELKRAPINVTSNQEMQKSTKIRNTLTSFTYIVMQIMQGISLTDAQSPQHLISSMVTS